MTHDTLVQKFIYSCSHDLRGPVSSIQGLVKLVEEHPQAMEAKDCIRMIGECSNKLDDLIHGLQQFMQIEAMSVKPCDVPIHNAIDSVIEEFCDEIETHKIEIQRNIPPLTWRTDFYCITEVLKKLISNCISFRDKSKRKSHIAIDAMRKHSNLFLRIRDNGVGIPANLQSRVFDVFFRAHESSTGNGIGLFLVKRIVMKLTGQVMVRSEEGIGTTVLVRLP